MCSCCKVSYYGQTQRHFFMRDSKQPIIALLAGKFVKTSKKLAIFDPMLLDGQKVSIDSFSICLKEQYF